MKKNRLFFMFAALFVAAAVMFSCQKEELQLEELSLKSSKKINVTAELVVSPSTATICLNTEVTLTAKAYQDSDGDMITATGGKIQIEEYFTGDDPNTDEVETEYWLTVATFVDLPSFATFKFTPIAPVDRKFRAHFIGMKDHNNSTDEKVVTIVSCGCDDYFALEGASECPYDVEDPNKVVTARFANFKFVAGENGVVEIQGGLTKGAKNIMISVNDGTPYAWTVGHVITITTGVLAECDEVLVAVTWEADNEEVIDSWSVKRDGIKVGESVAKDCVLVE